MKYAFILFLFTFLCQPLQVDGQTPKPTYGALLGQAFGAKAKGQYQQAIAALKEAIRLDSSEKYWRYYNLAEFYTLAADYSPAFSYLDSVLHSNIADKVHWRNQTFGPLWKDPRWQPFRKKIEDADALLLAKQKVFDQWQAKWLKERQEEYEQVISNKSGQELYLALQRFSYKKPLVLQDNFLSLRVAINDSVDTRCYLRFPPGYDSRRTYPVLFFLHGAVHANQVPLVADSLSWQMAGGVITQMADSLGYILAIPFANKDYNWMEPDAGWSILPNTVRLLRQLVNIDNNRLYLSGHSNGATGVFSYLLREPSDFAGFYGFNTQPRVRTGGSFLMNAQNRSFYAVAVDKDYYYPSPALDTLTLLAQSLGINFTDKTYSGFPHWFPYTKDFTRALPDLIADLQSKKRNPYSHQLYWETDDIRFGRCDWIAIEKLDTLSQPSSWQQAPNFPITLWYSNENSSSQLDTLIWAFEFPRRSAAIKASYEDNTFTLFTSRVGEVRILISPHMVNLNKRIKIKINNKRVFNKKIPYQDEKIRQYYQAWWDQQALWVNSIHFHVKEK